MKKNALLVTALIVAIQLYSQKTYQLDECRQMALEHNKTLQISKETIKAADELKKAAFTQFLPNFSANAAYTWSFFVLGVIPRIFNLPHIGLTSDIIKFMIPFLFATVFFSMTISVFLPNRETSLMLFMAFMFKYSERPGTLAAKKLPDNVSEETKIRRLNEIIALQNEISNESNQQDIGKCFEVLVEGFSKRSKEQLFGRTSQNKVVVFAREGRHIGEIIKVRITSASSATLLGEVVD